MRSRRKAREAALQALYEIEVGGSEPEEAVARMSESKLPQDQLVFAQSLANGVLQHQTDLDGQLSSLIQDYSFKRVAAVDRNIMRICAFELLFLPHMPPAVSINEAVEMAKKFSTSESGRFVNGVLGKFLASTNKCNWNPSEHPMDITEEPSPVEEPVEVEPIESPEEAERLLRIGAWKIKEHDDNAPTNH